MAASGGADAQGPRSWSRVRAVWSRLRSSFWFVPALLIGASMAAAVALVELEGWHAAELREALPRLFGAGADGSRSMLSAIATSMVTVAGVVFSITIVVLSQTSAQYSPRVLRNFMSDGPTQVVLGVFLGVFSYCLVVLRTIRGPDNGDFIPALAVLGGIAYAVAGVALLVFFIHHVAQGIQASSILQRIAHDTAAAMDRLFPEEFAEPADDEAVVAVPAEWTHLQSTGSGYITWIDGDALVDFAFETGRVVRMERVVGEFVAEGARLLAASGTAPLSEAQCKRLRAGVLLERQRTVEQDAAFGLRQLTDVALKALSPGVNDPTTAAMCTDQLGALLARLARRRMPSACRSRDGRLCLMAPAPGYGELVTLALAPVVQHSRKDLQVLAHLLDAIELLVECAPRGRRGALGPLLRQVEMQLRTAGRSPTAGVAGRRARDLWRRVRLDEESAGRPPHWPASRPSVRSSGSPP